MASADYTEAIKAKWNERAKSSAMDVMFDHTGYITIGYYKTWEESVGQSAMNMTERVAEIGGINEHSHVLDLGCGRGAPILDTALRTGCSVVGLDLSEEHVLLCQSRYESYKSEKSPKLKAEFYAGSFYDFPPEVLKQEFTHVIMQTSLFYAHHKIGTVLSQVAKVLGPGGKFIATDFYRNIPEDELKEFMKFNSMERLLTLDQIKDEFEKQGMRYLTGENLDKHCVRCNKDKGEKVIRLKLQGPNVDFFKNRETFVDSGRVTFQLVVAEKN